MKRTTVLVVLAVLALASEAALLAVLSTTTQFTVRKNVVLTKLSGAAPHASSLDVLSVVLPAAARPGVLPEVDCPEAYFHTPVWLTRTESDRMALWATPLGQFWASPRDGALLGCLINEESTLRIYDRPPVSVRPGDVVIDGGAHVGTFSRLALRNGAGQVVAFEPDPRNVEYLRRNLEKEIETGRLLLVQKALWEHAGSLQFSMNARSAASKISEELSPQELTVPCTSIDQSVRELGLARVDFIKLDIEGAETRALFGARSTLSRFSPRIAVCTYHAPEDPARITEVVLRAQPRYWLFSTATQAYFYRGDLRNQAAR